MAPKTKVGKLEPDAFPGVREDYQWTGICACGFITTGWVQKKQAKMRIDAHSNEHDTGELMPPKEEVEALTPDKFPPAPAVDDPADVPLWDEVQ